MASKRDNKACNLSHESSDIESESGIFCVRPQFSYQSPSYKHASPRRPVKSTRFSFRKSPPTVYAPPPTAAASESTRSLVSFQWRQVGGRQRPAYADIAPTSFALCAPESHAEALWKVSSPCLYCLVHSPCTCVIKAVTLIFVCLYSPTFL